MRRRDLILALPLAALSGPVLAAGGGEGEKDKAAGQYVDLSPVALPVVVNRQLVNYVFVQVRVNLVPRADPVKLRDKEPYFRDALVRAGHRTPFTRADDYTRLDDARLAASLKASVAAISGPGLVASIQVMSETPKRRTGLPKPAGKA